MDLVLGRENPTDPVALTGSTGLPVALYLLEVQMGQVFDAGVEGTADVTVLVVGDPFCKHRWRVGAREGGWGGKVRNSHDGGYFWDVVHVPRWFQTGRLRLVGHMNSMCKRLKQTQAAVQGIGAMLRKVSEYKATMCCKRLKSEESSGQGEVAGKYARGCSQE